MRDANLSPTLGEDRQDTMGIAETPSVRLLSFRPWYGLATLLYMGGITWLSSIQRQPGSSNVILEYGLNLGHVPLYAGLTCLLIKTIVPKHIQFLSTRACAGAALVLVGFAVLDEWHQAFVPGRSASVIDLMLDVMGIGTALLFFRLTALIREKS